MTFFRSTIILLQLIGLSSLISSASTQEEITAARGVIERFAEGHAHRFTLSSTEEEEGKPVYITKTTSDGVSISGSSGVALCKGFYDYIKSYGAGISSWTGKRFEFPILPADLTEQKKVVSPVKYHYYFNVVTYGYTMPYWDWTRWEKEIDWMALHGIDMPLALIAHEAITARVFKKLGLTDQEIAEYFVGPAHLPWMRMGNISGIDGPLPQEWHTDQIELQHKILQRMRSLGMTPICPGFSGFVPPALKRLFPDIKLVETHWGGRFNNWMLSPDQKLFTTIGKMFVMEWEKEFGTCSHYLVDSFNEMDVPFPPHDTPERYQLLSDYGNKVYQSIKEGSPNAVWVMQGWMFGYQRNIWDPKSLEALVSKVPDDKMLLLDLAVDYNKNFWHNGANWDFYKGFFNKDWIYSVIPNMGGKTGMTGILDFYANGHLEALNSPNRGHLKGIGMAPEGFENNEVIYELMADAGWSDEPIDLDAWLENYTHCRYGDTNEALENFWKLMRQSVYGSFTDHPRFNWQFRPGQVAKGSINTNPEFYKAIESFASCAQSFQGNKLYISDLTELTAAYLGGKIELLIQASEMAMQDDDMNKAREYEKEIEALMLGMDRLLASHPIHRLDVWLDYARKHGSSAELKDYYEKNARRLVTIWGPPVDDYAAKIWSGLIRDYYLPRRKEYLKSRFDSSVKSNLPAWERNWVETNRGVSSIQPYGNPITAAQELIARASKVSAAIVHPAAGTLIGHWKTGDVAAEWKELTWTVSPATLKKSKAIRFTYTKGVNKLDISGVKIEMDGKIVVDIRQEGTTGIINRNNVFRFSIPGEAQGNNSCTITARVRSDGKADSNGVVELVPNLQKAS